MQSEFTFFPSVLLWNQNDFSFTTGCYLADANF